MHNLKRIYSLQALNFLQNCSLKIGLLGGSFNPAHLGHLKISEAALKFFDFDFIIWLVALQNPMKASYDSDIFMRSFKAAEIINNPQILVTTAEYDIGSIYLYKVLRILRQRFSSVKFSWLMGVDNLESFHNWEFYREISDKHDIIIFDRPGTTRFFSCSRFTSSKSVNNGNKVSYHYGAKNSVSSTEIRQKIN